MSLVATGTVSSMTLAAVQASTAQAAGPVLAFSQGGNDYNHSSFTIAENLPSYRVIPVPGGMLVPSQRIQQTVEAGIATDGLGLIGALLLVSIFPFAMNFITRTKQIVTDALGGKEKDATPEPEFTPFVRRGEEVSIFNPVRIGGEELPGRAVKDPEALSNMFGKKGIQ